MSKYTAALITGASSGIGLELAKIMAREGHNLVLVARSENTLFELKKQLEQKYNIKIKIIIQDLKYYNAPQTIFDAVENDKIHVNILVNNAGFGVYGEFKDTDLEKELEMIQVNATALTHLTKLFLPKMIENNSGRILNVASTASFIPGPLMSVYYATKAYVLSFSQALAEELDTTNIKVVTLCPGPTKTNFANNSGNKDTKLFNEKIPEAKEVAEYAYQKLIDGKRVAIHGIKNKAIITTSRIIPRNIITKAVKKIQSKKSIDKTTTENK
jgi:hypothetical protein